MTWMQEFFGIDAAAEVRRGLTISGVLLVCWMLIQFMIVPIDANAGIDANVAFKQAPVEGAEVKGTAQVVVSGQTVSGLRAMSVAIEAVDNTIPSIPSGAGKTAAYDLGTTTAELQFTWDSATMTPYNGVYRLVATADSVLGERSTAQVSSLAVNNPPAAPSGVNAQVDGELPLVTWTPNLEPDLIGYRVARLAASTRTDLGLVRTASIKDEAAPKGIAIRYEVTALRHSPLSADGIASSAAQTPALTLASAVLGDAISTPSDVPDLKPATAAAPVKAKTETVLAPNRNVGFEEYLPYEQPIPMKVEPPVEAPAELFSPPQESSPSLTRARVELIKYLAASMLLLVGALHTARMARRVLISI